MTLPFTLNRSIKIWSAEDIVCGGTLLNPLYYRLADEFTTIQCYLKRYHNPQVEMYKLNLARDYRANSGENTWREMFLLRYHCWYEVNTKEKEIKKI